jgi:hypothetical protein
MQTFIETFFILSAGLLGLFFVLLFLAILSGAQNDD